MSPPEKTRFRHTQRNTIIKNKRMGKIYNLKQNETH